MHRLVIYPGKLCLQGIPATSQALLLESFLGIYSFFPL